MFSSSHYMYVTSGVGWILGNLMPFSKIHVMVLKGVSLCNCTYYAVVLNVFKVKNCCDTCFPVLKLFKLLANFLVKALKVSSWQCLCHFLINIYHRRFKLWKAYFEYYMRDCYICQVYDMDSYPLPSELAHSICIDTILCFLSRYVHGHCYLFHDSVYEMNVLALLLSNASFRHTWP